MFKFWPSQTLKEAWLGFVDLINNNLLALILSMKILHSTCEQFSARQAAKLNKNAPQKKAESGMKAVDKYDQLSRSQRQFQRGDFVKFFDSSESEEDSDRGQEKSAVS